MNRTDRLVAMVMHLQGRRVVRAEDMAAHFEVSVRTIYRDIAALGEAGVPIAGEAGVGYSLVRSYRLPPVMLTAATRSWRVRCDSPADWIALGAPPPNVMSWRKPYDRRSSSSDTSRSSTRRSGT